LKSLMRLVDRFCARHPRFGIPNLMIYIVVGNVIVWLFQMMDTTGRLVGLLYFSPAGILRGQVWRLLSFVLVPDSFGFFMLIALYFYYFIGSTLEREWGSAKFTVFYSFGILFTVLYGFLIYAITGRNYTVSASYLNLSLFFSFAVLFPDTQVLLFFIIPVKIKWLALLDAAFFVFAIVTNKFPGNLLPVVAVLNFLLFCWSDLMAVLTPVRARFSKGTVNFRREARRIRREQAQKPYRYKCAVCGRTDAAFPNLEFRYCSKCSGFHCYCQDHINSHVHFTE